MRVPIGYVIVNRIGKLPVSKLYKSVAIANRYAKGTAVVPAFVELPDV